MTTPDPPLPGPPPDPARTAPGEEVLHGGVGNAGLVVRIGDVTHRPAGAHSPTVHALLAHVRAAGFDGVPEPLGIADGREQLRFVPGDVPVPPFPAWSQTDAVLASTAALLRRFHDATAGFVAPADAWDRELADPRPGDVICHNDVCPENVVYRDGAAVALLDFDFAAPGRRVFDLASLARMCVPIDTDDDAARTGRRGLDPFARLRVVANAYGLTDDRAELVDVLAEQMRGGGTFVQRRVDAGDPAFTAMWNQMGGAERYRRRERWFDDHRPRFLAALA
jgi:Phosphotransferase enzyme family